MEQLSHDTVRLIFEVLQKAMKELPQVKNIFIHLTNMRHIMLSINEDNINSSIKQTHYDCDYLKELLIQNFGTYLSTLLFEQITLHYCYLRSQFKDLHNNLHTLHNMYLRMNDLFHLIGGINLASYVKSLWQKQAREAKATGSYVIFKPFQDTIIQLVLKDRKKDIMETLPSAEHVEGFCERIEQNLEILERINRTQNLDVELDKKIQNILDICILPAQEVQEKFNKDLFLAALVDLYGHRHYLLGLIWLLNRLRRTLDTYGYEIPLSQTIIENSYSEELLMQPSKLIFVPEANIMLQKWYQCTLARYVYEISRGLNHYDETLVLLYFNKAISFWGSVPDLQPFLRQADKLHAQIQKQVDIVNQIIKVQLSAENLLFRAKLSDPLVPAFNFLDDFKTFAGNPQFCFIDEQLPKDLSEFSPNDIFQPIVSHQQHLHIVKTGRFSVTKYHDRLNSALSSLSYVQKFRIQFQEIIDLIGID
jgi:hypothetical protein